MTALDATPELVMDTTDSTSDGGAGQGQLNGRPGPVRWLMRGLPSLGLFVLVLGVWEFACRALAIPHYLLPMPSAIAVAAWENAGVIWSALLVTLTETLIAFTVSLVAGVLLAVVLSSSRLLERAAYPYVILLQTMPAIAIAPLIIIWFGVTTTAVVIIAAIMAFFPVLTNTLIGLRSADHNLRELYMLLNASKLQTLLRLRLPSALPYVVTGIKLCGTMAVVGVIAGEYISGIGSGNAGLGFLITKTGIRLETAEMFAAGLATAVLGIIFNVLVTQISRLLLGKWHESELSESA